VLARLNDGTEKSDEELEKMNWNEKTKLVQKDPVSCSRFLDHRGIDLLLNFLVHTFVFFHTLIKWLQYNCFFHWWQWKSKPTYCMSFLSACFGMFVYLQGNQILELIG
jgi:hypothetical protein